MKSSQVKRPKDCTTDRGYRGKKTIGETNINIPGPPKAKASPYEKSKQRKRFRKRAGIKPIIGHLKSDFRMKRNYLKGLIGDEINVLLAGAAFNFKKWLNEAVLALISLWSYIYNFHNRKNEIRSYLDSIHPLIDYTLKFIQKLSGKIDLELNQMFKRI